MVERVGILHPERLQVKKDGNFSYGYDQEWFTDDWKRLAGCGPTTATQVVSYIKFRENLLPVDESSDGDQALDRMNEVWEFVKPRYGGGLYKGRWMEEGLNHYFAQNHMDYEAKFMPIYPLRANADSLDEVVNFLKAAFVADSPVAFLNRHRGKEQELSTWHWVPIVAMEISSGDVRCTVYDEGMSRIFSLRSWLKDNLLGGGFIYAEKKV